MVPRPETEFRETAAAALESAGAQVITDGVKELMACASHDLIGPLNRAATLLTLLIQRYRNQIDAEGDRVLEFLLASSARMEEVAAGVGRYIGIISAPRERAVVDLNESLAAAHTLLRKRITESGAVIEAGALPRVRADAGHMTTVFELLVGNSIKFRRAGAAPHIRISSDRTGDVHDIAVADDGIGIEPQYAEAVFQPFRRLNGPEYGGTGLGLTTAKLIAGLHGGSMWVEPRVAQMPDRGVSVHFILPADSRL